MTFTAGTISNWRNQSLRRRERNVVNMGRRCHGDTQKQAPHNEIIAAVTFPSIFFLTRNDFSGSIDTKQETIKKDKRPNKQIEVDLAVPTAPSSDSVAVII